MQGVGSRTKITLAVVTGISTGLGLALFTRRSGWRLSRFLRSYRMPLSDMKVVVAGNESLCVNLVNDLKRDIVSSRVLGFDCEWVQIGTKRNRVALVQLATGEGHCGLFQIHLYSTIPAPLQELLEDRSILKVGIDPSNDAKYLLEDYGIQVTGTVDIRHLVDLQGRTNVGGLAAVVSSELGVELPKNLAVRVSNWEAGELSSDQSTYAAKDALSSLLVFNKLIIEKVKFPFFSSKEDQWREIFKYCETLIDVQFKNKKKKISPQTSPLPPLLKKRPSNILERDESGMPNNSSPGLQGKKSYRAYCPRKSPLYENAFMLAPDGAVLCTCDTKKAEWYVSKGLATVVDTEPFKIQLTFEPSARVKGPSGQYYTVEKENKCVTCGRKDSYIRKKIVPHEYRKFFPDCMKKHQSHDVLLLCSPCHAQSNISDFQLRLELAKVCNAPIGSDDRVTEDNKSKMLRSAARALLNKSHKIPAKRFEELNNFIQENCHCDVTDDLLNELKDMDISVVNEDYIPHGLLIVEYFARDGVRGLMRLEKIWREHFIKEMNPKHLPLLWSVDHYHEDDRDYLLDANFLNRLKNTRFVNC